MLGLPESERISMIRSAVLIQSTHVTDRQTDRRTELQWHLYALQHTEHTAASKKEREREIEKQNTEEI